MDTAVGLVKVYLELCGYFVLAELPVRAAGEHGYRDETDLDIVAVRFPHAAHSSHSSHAARATATMAATGVPNQLSRPLDVFLGVDPALYSFEEGVDVIVGEVKEGKAHINPALHRAETVAFALRRIGCCPEVMVDEEACIIAQGGEGRMTMAGGLPCMVRLVAFAGHGTVGEYGVHTVLLAHCAGFIAERLRDGRDVLSGTQFKDPVLGLLALQDKLSLQPGTPREPVGTNLP